MRKIFVGYVAVSVFALVVVFGAISGALPQASAQATAAKGPDILGLRTGMTPQEVYEKLKEIDPTHRVTVGQVLIPPVLGNQPVVYGMSPEGLVTGSEIIAVAISMPPNPQQAYIVHRQLNGTIHTTVDQIIASLRQKYGQESKSAVPGPLMVMDWVYDEQGQLASPPVGAAKLHDCMNAGFTLVTIGNMPNPSEPPQPGVSSQPILDPFPVLDPTKNLPCQGWVIVQAEIAGGAQNGVYTYSLNTTITNVNIEKRAAVALSNALNNVAAKKQQQDLDKAHQQSVPKL